MVPKPHPARRGYVIIMILSGLAVWACTEALHVAPVIAALIVIGGVLFCSGTLSLRHRGINREIKNRK